MGDCELNTANRNAGHPNFNINCLNCITRVSRSFYNSSSRRQDDQTGEPPMAEIHSMTDRYIRLENALKRIQEEKPSSKPIVESFGQIFLARAQLKGEIELDPKSPNIEIDPAIFKQGAPIADTEFFVTTEQDLRKTAKVIAPVIANSLPTLEQHVQGLMGALENNSLDLQRVQREILRDSEEEIQAKAKLINLDKAIFVFLMGQFIKPLAEIRAESLVPLPEDLTWLKGYCPICGSWPYISVLREKEGQRWLKCSFCAHEWRFMRTQCPCCENEDPESLEFFYAEDKPHERVEVCNRCKKYIVSLDLRERVEDCVIEAEALGLVYLDILAQEKGYLPAAITEWNVLGTA